MKPGKVIGKSLDVLIGGAQLALTLHDKEITDKLGHLVWDLGNASTPAQLIRVYYALNVGMRLLNLYSEKTMEKLAGVSSFAFTGLYASSYYSVGVDPLDKMNWVRFGLDLTTLTFNAFLVKKIYSDKQDPPIQPPDDTLGGASDTSYTAEETVSIKDTQRNKFGLIDKLKVNYSTLIQQASIGFH